MFGENIKNLTESNYKEFSENNIYNIKSILKEVDNYDFINIDTTFDLLDYINKREMEICVINLSKNKYFCSNKYCLIKDKLYRYDKLELISHFGDNYSSYAFIANNDEYFIKFCSRINLLEFYEESIKEVEFLHEYKNRGIDFVDRQEIYDYDINEEYVISVRRLLKGDFLSEKLLSEIDKDKKLLIIEEVFRQLSYIESIGFIYNDVNCANVMFDGQNATVIDLGSNQKYSGKSVFLYTFSRLNAFSIYDSVIIFVYNVFNIEKDYIYETKFSQNIVNKIINVYNYESYIMDLIIELLRLKYKDSCSFNDIFEIIKNYKNGSYKNTIINDKKFIKNNNINYIDNICNINTKEINTVVNIQYSNEYNCNILKNNKIKYLQICRDDENVIKNRLLFNNDTSKIFLKLDILKEPLPNADIIFCSDVFDKLNNDQIWLVLENIRNSGAKYFALNQYNGSSKKVNKDLKTSSNKYINLTMPPFNFPKSNFLVPIENSNYIAVYYLDEVEFFMKYHSNFMSSLRLNIYKNLRDTIDKLIDAFSRYKDGINLLKDALFYNSLDWDSFYYDRKYKSIISDGCIFDEYVKILLLIHMKDMNRIKESSKDDVFKLLNDDNFSQFSLIVKEFIIWYFYKNKLFG